MKDSEYAFSSLKRVQEYISAQGSFRGAEHSLTQLDKGVIQYCISTETRKAQDLIDSSAESLPDIGASLLLVSVALKQVAVDEKCHHWPICDSSPASFAALREYCCDPSLVSGLHDTYANASFDGLGDMETATAAATFAETSNYGAQIGVNSGVVTNNFQLSGIASSLPQLPALSPSIIIPFRRDRDFVERDILDEIWQRTSEPGARVGLLGLGGVGKSQLAIEYAYRVREAHPRMWVFWVHASSGTRFEESFRKIAERLQLNRWNDPKTDVLGLVHTWLSDEGHGEWKMIVDNADYASVMFEPWHGGTTTHVTAPSTSRSLFEYLPMSPNGSIVITSRVREVVEGLDVSSDDLLEVGPMEVAVAEKLLRRKLKTDERGAPHDTIVRLLRHLDSIPLAITQAAAYINQRTPRITVARYIEILETDDSERVKVLQKGIRDPRRDGHASNSIITTWYVSFEHLRQTQDSAARLLALMSLFDREGIPDYLLQAQYFDNSDEADDFEDDVAMLRTYSLISVGTSDDIFDMHRLVQFSTKTWLAAHGELIQWQQRYIDILDRAFPTGDHANWSVCKALFPHIEAMMSYHVPNKEHQKLWATVLYRGTWYALGIGQYVVAEKMGQKCLVALEEIEGVNQIDTLNSIDILALVLRYQGKYEQAEEMNRRALAGREKVLGADHPDTLTSVSNLALVLRYQGKYEQAEEMNRRALAGSEKVLGADHPDTLTTVYCLANLLEAKQDRREALKLYHHAVNGYIKVLGLAHPTTQACQRHTKLLLDQMNTP